MTHLRVTRNLNFYFLFQKGERDFQNKHIISYYIVLGKYFQAEYFPSSFHFQLIILGIVSKLSLFFEVKKKMISKLKSVKLFEEFRELSGRLV